MTRQKKATKKRDEHKRLSVVERVVFWIGSLIAIATGAVGLFDRANEPSPARLEVDFSWTNSAEMTIALDAVARGSQWTESIPACLRVRNVGGSVARDVVLRLAHGNRTRFMGTGIELASSPFFGTTDKDIVTTIRIGDINPGAEASLDDRVNVQFSNTVDVPGVVLGADAPFSGAVLSMVVQHEWEAKVSASDVPQRLTILYVHTGKSEILDQEGKPFIRLRGADEWQNWRPEKVNGG